MPFTLSHPAAILPFRRYAARSTSLCALVIGSMSPDFVYFASIGMKGAFSHSPTGLFLFCLPASLFFYVVFYSLLRLPLVTLMPEAIASRLNPRPEWAPATVSSLLIVVSSILIGAVTHVLWDSFTHANTFVVKNVDVLRMRLALAEGVRMPVYKVLQHASTVLGLAALAVAAYRWMRRTPPQFVRPYRLSVAKRMWLGAGFLLAGIAGSVAGATTRPVRTFEHLVFNGVVNGMAWMALAIVIFCVVWQMRTLRGRGDV